MQDPVRFRGKCCRKGFVGYGCSGEEGGADDHWCTGGDFNKDGSRLKTGCEDASAAGLSRALSWAVVRGGLVALVRCCGVP